MKTITIELTEEQTEALGASVRNGLGEDPAVYYPREIVNQANRAVADLRQQKLSEAAKDNEGEMISILEAIKLANPTVKAAVKTALGL